MQSISIIPSSEAVAKLASVGLDLSKYAQNLQRFQVTGHRGLFYIEADVNGLYEQAIALKKVRQKSLSVTG